MHRIDFLSDGMYVPVAQDAPRLAGFRPLPDSCCCIRALMLSVIWYNVSEDAAAKTSGLLDVLDTRAGSSTPTRYTPCWSPCRALHAAPAHVTRIKYRLFR